MASEERTPVSQEEVQPKQAGRFVRFLDRLFGSEHLTADQEKTAALRAEVIAFFKNTPPELLIQNIETFSNMLAQGVDKEFMTTFLDEIAPSRLGKRLVLVGTLMELDHRQTKDTRWALSGWEEFSDYAKRPFTEIVDTYAEILSEKQDDSFEKLMSAVNLTRESLGQQPQSE